MSCDCAQSGGKVEIDFQNNTLNVLSGENKSTVMLRHAYFEVKDEDFRLLVGQTWDVISPLYPGMLMYSVGWDGGNIGYRRAQFRGERFLNFSDISLVTAQLAIAPQIFVDNTTTTTPRRARSPANRPIGRSSRGASPGRSGSAARAAIPITVGLSGHIGEQEFDTTLLGRDNRLRTWSGNIDVRVPLTEQLGVQGECQIGENLGTFLGGIGQGIDPVTLNTIRDAGGWFEIWYDWTPSAPQPRRLLGRRSQRRRPPLTGERTYNQFYYGNLIYDVTKNFLVGMEVSSWKTLYIGQLPGDSVRIRVRGEVRVLKSLSVTLRARHESIRRHPGPTSFRQLAGLKLPRRLRMRIGLLRAFSRRRGSGHGR